MHVYTTSLFLFLSFHMCQGWFIYLVTKDQFLRRCEISSLFNLIVFTLWLLVPLVSCGISCLSIPPSRLSSCPSRWLVGWLVVLRYASLGGKEGGEGLILRFFKTSLSLLFVRWFGARYGGTRRFGWECGRWEGWRQGKRTGRFSVTVKQASKQSK